MRALVPTALAALVLAGTSAASWSVSAPSTGRARAATLVGNMPAATATKVAGVTVSIAVSWAATTGATGYTVQRTGGAVALSGNCAGTLAANSCADMPVVAGTTYTYTVTPVTTGWTGTPSPAATVTA